LNGGEIGGQRWEAYEAPTGRPIAKAPWSSVRFWLLDISEELRAALDELNTAPPLSLEHIWITASGRALFLDFPLAGKMPPLDVHCAQRFLAQVADAGLDLGTPIPPDAHALIAALKRNTFDRLEFIIGNLTSLSSKPADISRGWRAASLLMLPACFALLGILGAFMVNFDRMRWERAWKNLYPERPNFLDVSQTYIGRAEDNENSEDTQLARAYLVTHFADVITNQTFWSNPQLAAALGAHERELLRKAVAGPVPAANVASEAERVVPRWIVKEERQARRIPLGLFFGAILLGLVCVGIAELIAAVIFRRSFALNLFGIAVVDACGQLATRPRLLSRWLVGTLPGLAIFFWGMAVLVQNGTLAFFHLAASVAWLCGGTIVAVAIGFAILNPSGGMADRIAGTRLVPK
jgi:eukaryotic-like serine/threonine-protein kinase